ncbi:NUDIX domain-containing protein [Luteococcus sp. Sow4_B9]|uniref:NUDIX domain-containing protein n=1 Tax=Luteococcus sp. Sow4_B9 TaxID=3438792 RepID=UPI003F96C4EC
MASQDDPRRTKRRRGARVLVRDGDSVLLMQDSDPGVPGSSWWVLPGGGIDPDEDSVAAAARELAEETGLAIRADQLQGPVARRVAIHGYSDRILVQDEEIFLLDHPRFDVDTTGFTATERLRMGQWGWFTPQQIASMTIWPRQTPELARWAGEACVDLGEMDESTVPLPG